MADKTDSERLGIWLCHHFADDLRLIIETDVPRVEPLCTPAELRDIRALIGDIEQFCLGDGEPPQRAKSPEPTPEATPAQLQIHDIGDFCERLSAEWGRLERSDRRRLRAALTRAFSVLKHPQGISATINWDEFAIALFAVMAWIVLFAIGYTVHAAPYEEILKEPRTPQQGTIELVSFVGALFMFIMASIPTNVLLLACLTGVLGTAYRRTTGHREHQNPPSKAHDYLCAITTGFFVYLIMIGGLLSLSVAEVLTYETQEKYLKLAGTVSMFAFLVGYDRQIVAWLLRRAASFLTQSEAGAINVKDAPLPSSPASSVARKTPPNVPDATKMNPTESPTSA